MKIDVTRTLTNLDGQPITNGDRPVTLGFVCADALLTPQEGDAQVSGLAARCYHLARKLTAGGDSVDLDAEDIALIKARIERCHAPLIVGQTWDLLEGR